MIQQYFQPKIGRKIRIFNLAGETTFLYKKKKKSAETKHGDMFEIHLLGL